MDVEGGDEGEDRAQEALSVVQIIGNLRRLVMGMGKIQVQQTLWMRMGSSRS